MARDVENSIVYAFDGFRLDTSKRLLYGADGSAVPLKAKAFDTLLFLVEHSGRVVERDELLAAVWPDTIVEENNLTQHISSLRRVLGEKPDEHRFIATVAGRGYMFVADVKTIGADDKPNIESRQRVLSNRRVVLTVGLVACVLLLLGAIYKYESSGSDGRVRSIAVLPFTSLGGQLRDASLEAGMTLDLITKLARAEGIEVRPYSAVKRYDSLDRDALEVGRELNVDAVLVATLQRSAEKVQISGTLTRVADGRQLWADRFNEAFTEDFFDVQQQLAERVADALTVRLSATAQKRFTDNFDAYTFYLSGRSHQARLSPSELNSAIADFRKAIELDPNYALAYTGIADSYRALVLSGEYAPAEMIKKSNEAAETAVTLDPQLAEAHSSVGFNRFWFYRDWAGAEEAMKRSLEIDPKLATGHLHYAHLLSNIGRNDEAIAEAEKVRSLAGYDPFFATLQGMVYQHAGQFETALARFKLASDLDENLWLPHMFAAVTYLDARRYDQEAFDSARKATELNHSQSISPAYEVVALVRLGRNDEAKRILEELLKRSEYKYVPSYHLAIAYVGIDDRENALKWIEKSVAEQDPKIVFLKVDHIWDPLRSEPRFIALMRKMNFPEQK